MSPTITRVSFAFAALLVLSVVGGFAVSSAHAQAWKERLQSAAGASQAAAGAASPEQAHALATHGTGRLTGEKTHSGLNLIAPPVLPKPASVNYDRHDRYNDHGRIDRQQERRERVTQPVRDYDDDRPMARRYKGLIVGGLLGAALGGLIGLAFGGAGVAAGAVVGGILGAVGGYVLGQAADAVSSFIDGW